MKLQDITDNILMNAHKIGDILQYNGLSHSRFLFKLIEKNIEKREMSFQILGKDKQPTILRDEIFRLDGYYRKINGELISNEPSVRNFSRYES